MIDYKVNVDKLKSDKEFKSKVMKNLRAMDGHSPIKCPGHKSCNCICEDFKREVALGKRGPCECGLYVAYEKEEEPYCIAID